MKLNDKSVLEPLHLEPADLSSGRRFVAEMASLTAGEDDTANLTTSVLQTRGIFTRALGARKSQSAAENASLHVTSARQLPQGVPKPPVVWVPVIPLSRDGFDVLQKFEGTVLSVTDDSFVARMVDKTRPRPEEEAEIPIAEIAPGDRELVKPGAIFYWVIGYRRETHGQLSRSSVIRFQRLPSWSPSDMERAKKEAETFLSFFDLDRANRPA